MTSFSVESIPGAVPGEIGAVPGSQSLQRRSGTGAQRRRRRRAKSWGNQHGTVIGEADQASIEVCVRKGPPLKIALRELLEKGLGAGFLREMIGVAAETADGTGNRESVRRRPQ